MNKKYFLVPVLYLVFICVQREPACAGAEPAQATRDSAMLLREWVSALPLLVPSREHTGLACRLHVEAAGCPVFCVSLTVLVECLWEQALSQNGVLGAASGPRCAQ